MRARQALIVLCVVLAVMLSACVTTPEPPAPGTSVEIKTPADGDTVELATMVRGTSQAIPSGSRVWVVVYPHEAGRYYPQNKPAEVDAKGSWTSQTYVGIEADVGGKFDILAVLADQDGQDAFERYLRDARDKTDWAGLEQLPDGVVLHHRIEVTRR